ncbi:hypothetical protein CAEBREN_15057 [Caenorhabditis brenneri]|uniref:Uncharacterized protein n=1 Tax=Caenorhabditis brenneri TaxID=135651 RepID=G0MHG7_CAEBE|nr:hypothetical protein CAEBREN_15057 [Caenorhabditis brenneri]
MEAPLLHNNDIEMRNQMEHLGGQDSLKRKTSDSSNPPAKKHKEDPVDEDGFSKPIPSSTTMGIDTPMDPDYHRLPKGIELGNLAREKFAGIMMAGLRDKYEIQIYCRLFEHFSYYPIYMFEQDLWVPAHEHAYNEVVRFRTPPSVLMAQARLA